MKRLLSLSIVAIVVMLALPPVLLRHSVTAQQEVILLLDVSTTIPEGIPGTPPLAARLWGWAIRRSDRWTGVVENYFSGAAVADLPGSIVTGGVRGASGVLRIFDGEIGESSFTLKGRIEQVNNALLFKIGDVRTFTGSWVTGRAVLEEPVSDGRVLTLNLAGTIIRR